MPLRQATVKLADLLRRTFRGETGVRVGEQASAGEPGDVPQVLAKPRQGLGRVLAVDRDPREAETRLPVTVAPAATVIAALAEG